MINRKKDSGFTLIELMIVIAVIGILAVVLVPKVGTVKTQAKSAGVDTNMWAVQGYVQSKINRWANEGKTAAQVATDITAAFSEATGEQIPNPYTSAQIDAVSGTSTVGANPANNALYVATDGLGADLVAADLTALKTKGTIVVAAEPAAGTILEVNIYSHGADGLLLSTVTVTP